MLNQENCRIFVLLALLLPVGLLGCGKPDLPRKKGNSAEVPLATTGPIDGTTAEAMRGEWIYSGKILNMSSFRESERPDNLRAVGFWANVRRAPLEMAGWRSEVLQARYRLVFTQYKEHPALGMAVIRITADSLTVPGWLTAHYTAPDKMRALEGVHLAKDSTLEFYLGTGHLMLVRWADSVLLSTHFSEDDAYSHDVWSRR